MPLVPEAYQRHHKGCPKADCAAAVSLKVCRGTSVPENRGRWYEVNWAVAHPTVPPLPALLLPPVPAVPQQSASSISDGDGSCNGKDCQAKGKHVRSCRTCSFKLCQICCRIAQRENNKGCAEKHHMSGRNAQAPAPTFGQPTSSISISDNLIDPQLRDSTPSASYIPHKSELALVAPVVPSAGATAVRDAFYDSSKPLRPEHYHARQTAREELEARTRRVAQRKAHEEEAKHSVRLLFWNEDGKDPKMYRVPVPKEIWPTFSLKLCSPAVRSALGITEATLIETFEPTQRCWCVHDVEVSRNIELETSTLLYRTRPETSSQAPCQHFIHSPSPPDHTSSNELTSIIIAAAIAPVAPTFIVNNFAVISRSINITAVSYRVAYSRDDCWTACRGCEWNGILATKMLSLCGSQQQKFSKVFPGHVFKPTTFKQNYRIWKQAPDSLKDRYVEAGLTNDGLWSRFRKEAAQLDVQSQGDTASPGENSDIADENTATAAARSVNDPVVVSVKLEPMEAEIPASASGLHVVVEDGKEVILVD
ncbi:hypothetical protein DENSPDRAFT_848996 [Dentipellis sp. KUC8613]|nr:hypothetical protein DENSPDRAFT_848996 [Dentipellis sp. KUC8613]